MSITIKKITLALSLFTCCGYAQEQKSDALADIFQAIPFTEKTQKMLRLLQNAQKCS